MPDAFATRGDRGSIWSLPRLLEQAPDIVDSLQLLASGRVGKRSRRWSPCA